MAENNAWAAAIGAVVVGICIYIVIRSVIDAYSHIEMCQHFDSALMLPQCDAHKCTGNENKDATYQLSKLDASQLGLWCDPVGDDHVIWTHGKAVKTRCTMSLRDNAM
jgi:hypothetical protein